jgi:hypothetical protein
MGLDRGSRMLAASEPSGWFNKLKMPGEPQSFRFRRSRVDQGFAFLTSPSNAARPCRSGNPSEMNHMKLMPTLTPRSFQGPRQAVSQVTYLRMKKLNYKTFKTLRLCYRLFGFLTFKQNFKKTCHEIVSPLISFSLIK